MQGLNIQNWKELKLFTYPALKGIKTINFRDIQMNQILAESTPIEYRGESHERQRIEYYNRNCKLLAVASFMDNQLIGIDAYNADLIGVN